jgi:hypothetical protein
MQRSTQSLQMELDMICQVSDVCVRDENTGLMLMEQSHASMLIVKAGDVHNDSCAQHFKH